MQYSEEVERLLDSRNFEGLVRVLENPALRKDACWALTKLHDIRAVAHLLEAIIQIDEEERYSGNSYARGLFAAMGDIAVPALIEALSDSRRKVIEFAIAGLGAIGDRRALSPLLSLLASSDNVAVRLGTIDSLGEIGDECAVAALLPFLNHGDDETVRRTAWALGLIRSQEAVSPLEAVLIQHKDPSVRVSAVHALGRIGGKTAVKILISALNDKTLGYESDIVSRTSRPILYVATAAAEALENISGRNYGLNAAAWQKWFLSRQSKTTS